MDNQGPPQLRTFERPKPPLDHAKQRRTWLMIAIGAAILAGVLLASTVWSGSWKAETKKDRVAVDERVIAPEKQCALQSTYESIKRALFARAARARGSDEAAFAKLSDFSLLRLESPVLRGVDEDLGRINCNGVAVLQLPPGVRVADGGSTLSSPIEYAVQRAADGTGNVVMLGNADAITTRLATIQRRGAAQSEPLTPPDMDPMTTPGGSSVINQVPGPVPAPAPAPAPPRPEPRQNEPEPRQGSSARPSFNCGNARTRGEIAVCNDSGLAALDRQMASQFYSALRRADPQQRARLQSTRSGFLAFRDRCRSDGCVADTYRGRMREISDIMSGSWNPGR